MQVAAASPKHATAKMAERINIIHYASSIFQAVVKRKRDVMECGYQSFAENFRECCLRSCNRLAYKREQTDPDYIAASEQCETLYQSLKERLEGDQLLLNRFDAAKNNENAIAMESIYQQGFQDCVCLLRWLGLLS